MKRELISLLIGAGAMGLIWAGSAYFGGNGTAPAPEAPVSGHPGKSRTRITGVYSALANKNFPGLVLRSNDFLVPLNRLFVTQHVLIDDPNDFYGSGGSPMYALLFGIGEGSKTHYFLTSGRQDREIDELVYLGEDIDIEKVAPEGNGYWMATYKDGRGRIGRGIVAIQALVGREPEKDPGIAQSIPLDPLAKLADDCDPLVWKINAEEFWRIYRKAVSENDRETVAKLYRFPVGGRFGTIYTRAEFVEKYDQIYDGKTRDWILNGCKDNKIWYSWRGAQLPDGEWLRNACGPNEPAGPLED